MGGNPETVHNDFEFLIEECRKIGLEINPTKCEIFFCGKEDKRITKKFDHLSPGIKVLSDDLELLGAAITEEAEERIFIKIHNKMKVLFERLKLLNNHMAFYLLKNCFGIPKLTYLLRTTAYFKHEHLLRNLDEDIKSAMESICNSKFDDQKYSIVSLPIRSGGLGIRKVSEICLPSFLSSVHSVIDLVTSMYPQLSDETMISDYSRALEMWFAHSDSIPDQMSNQRSWDDLLISQKVESLTFNSQLDKARYLASTVKESNYWLGTLPSKSVGTLLDNNTFRISVALRIGTDICSRHKCKCGDIVSEDGTHGLSCPYCVGRIPRHSDFNNFIHRSLKTGNIPSMREPPGMFRDDKKRVDGVTLIPWCNGQLMVWDATCSDTLAPSYLHLSAKKAGSVARKAADIKLNHYKGLTDQGYYILPFAIETLGPWCDEAIRFVNVLGELISERTGETRSKTYLKQRIGIALQRSNAASVMGTFRDDEFERLDEIFYIL